ncbi:MAG: phospholipase D-like domain-containing protein [Clostridiales bacterium]|nr:phospholipase D-like domain-containing protein [Clostridiales bacterium]MDY3747863.1 phospholipase D-like domain-containing protein [Lachnospiraceae bacterium]
MRKTKIKQIQSGLATAFIDVGIQSNVAYKPQFVFNNYHNGQKVIASIEDELLHCNEFSISVAFITQDGVTPLLQTLKKLEKRGVPGRIMTTDYLCFSDPVALDKLASLSNVELRMYQTDLAGNGFHTKGYLFRGDEEYRFIIGSSNMTQSALKRNMEWITELGS